MEVIDNRCAGRRRRFTPRKSAHSLKKRRSSAAEQQRFAGGATLQPVAEPAVQLASTGGRRVYVQPSAEQPVVPESEVKQLKARVRELERLLGEKMLANEIFKDAIEIAREKKTHLAVTVAREKGHPMKAIATALGVALPISWCKHDASPARRPPLGRVAIDPEAAGGVTDVRRPTQS